MQRLAFAVLSALMLSPLHASAQDRATHTLERADLEPWVDGLMPAAIAQGNIAGGVVVVVRNGEVILQKGYGYADVGTKRAVDPDRTLFRVGSISKIFTWTAVMQQVEAGRIDLDADIAPLLDFALPPAAGAHISMRHLMTHTAGFAETLKGDLRYDPSRLETLSQFVRSPPPRIFPAGEIPAYSNYGATLAGYIVQRVSREPFEEYVERHILRPLGMDHSTFRQPLPAALAADLSRGYPEASDEPIPFELCGPIPAGSLSATGADMGRFMMANLSMARGGAGSILRPETAGIFYGSVSRPIPGLNGMTLGFEANRDAPRIIGHGGDSQVFHSDMKLFLDDGTGLFIALNSTGRDGAAWDILTALYEQFTRRYFPVPSTLEPTLPTSKAHGELIASQRLQSSRRANASFVKLFALLGQQQADVNPSGLLALPSMTDLSGERKVWREVQPFIWREVHGTQRIGAVVENGRLRALGTDQFAGTQIYQPVGFLSSGVWIIPAVAIAIGLLLLTVIGWPIAAVRHGRTSSQATRRVTSMWPSHLARLTALINVAFLVGWTLIIRAGLHELPAFDEPTDKWMRLLHVLGIAALLGAGVAVWHAWLTWRDRRSAWARLRATALAAACIVITVFSFAFNLISVSLEY